MRIQKGWKRIICRFLTHCVSDYDEFNHLNFFWKFQCFGKKGLDPKLRWIFSDLDADDQKITDPSASGSGTVKILKYNLSAEDVCWEMPPTVTEGSEERLLENLVPHLCRPITSTLRVRNFSSQSFIAHTEPVRSKEVICSFSDPDPYWFWFPGSGSRRASFCPKN